MLRGCLEAIESIGNNGAPATPAGADCPPRVAVKLPDPGPATLVIAYRTANNQIILCRSVTGTLYYHGEYTGRPETVIVMRAKSTERGYIAQNKNYMYEIAGTEVIVRRDGKEISRQPLTVLPSPT